MNHIKPFAAGVLPSAPRTPGRALRACLAVCSVWPQFAAIFFGSYVLGFAQSPDTTPPSHSHWQTGQLEAASPTNINFSLYLSEVVTGVDAGDFYLTLSGGATGTIRDVLPVDGGRGYVIRVTWGGNTGTIEIRVRGGPSANIRDLAGNLLADNPASYTSFRLPPEIDIVGAGASIPSGSTNASANSATEFGSFPVGSGLARPFTVENRGSSTLTIGLPITITGPEAADFTTNNFNVAPGQTSLSLTPGSSATFLVTFRPSAVGLRRAQVSLANNDINENPYTFAIQGTGTAADTTAPTIVSFTAGTPDTSARTIAFTATYSEPVSTAFVSSFIVNLAGGAEGAISAISQSPASGMANSHTVVLNYGGTPGGTLSVSVRSSGSGINDASGNPYAGGGQATSPTFTIPGVVGAPDINVLALVEASTGRGVSIPSGSTTRTQATDFGEVAAWAGQRTNSFGIENMGSVLLSLTSPITVTGPHAADFVVVPPPSSSVSGGGRATFYVTFNPSAGGPRTATVTIGSNDPDENPYTFALFGTGVSSGAEIDVFGNGVMIADGDVTPSTADGTDFGSVPMAGGSVSVTYTVRNTGTAPLTMGSFSFEGENRWDFEILQAPPNELPAGGSGILVVRFAPLAGATGLRRVDLSCWTNDDEENPFNFTLQGMASAAGPAAPEIAVRSRGEIASGDATPSAGDGTEIPNVRVGNYGRETYILENLGSAPLNIGNITLTGSPAFALVDPVPNGSSIAPRASGFFNVVFLPTDTATATANVSIQNNDADENPYTFAIRATGVTPRPPPIAVSGRGQPVPAASTTTSTTNGTAFGDIPVGGVSATQTFTITNTGSSPITLLPEVIAAWPHVNTMEFVVPVQPSFASLAPGATTSFQVNFQPKYAGPRLGIVAISVGSSFDRYTFYVTGTGIAPGGSPPVISSPLAASTQPNAAFSYTIAASNSPTSFTATNLPAGLNFTSPTITGSVATAGTYNINITASNAAGTDSKVLQLTVAAAADTTPPRTNGWGGGQLEPASPNNVNFTHYFTEVVTGVDAGDFYLTFTGGATGTIRDVIRVDDGRAYVVRVEWGGTAGTIEIRIRGGATANIRDLAGNLFADTPSSYAAFTLPPEIDIVGGGVSIPSGSTNASGNSATEFGSVPSGSSVSRQFRVENRGPGTLNIGLPLTLTGPEAGDFSPNNFNLPAGTSHVTVAPGASTTFEVTFRPSALGLRRAQVNLASNDADESPYTFAIQGTSTTGSTGTAPVAPSNVVAEFLGTHFRIQWVDNSTDETTFTVWRSDDGGQSFRSVGSAAGNTTAFVDRDVPGTGTRAIVHYKVQAFNGSLASADSPVVAVAYGPGTGTFSSQDVGVTSPSGSASVDAGTGIWSVSGSGADIWNTADAFSYYWQRWSGDGEFTARVMSLDMTNGWAKAGLMFRESMSPDARNAFLMVTPSNGLELQTRTTTGGATSFASYAPMAAPVWLKLTRQGNVFQAYRSADGQNWVDAGSVTLVMSNPIFVGLAVTSHSPGTLCTARFSNVYLGAIRGAVAAPPTAPTALQATAMSPTEVELNWTDNSNDETGFHLERSTGGGPFVRVATPVANARSLRDSGLTASTTYSYRISAYSSAGDSNFSAIATVTTPAGPPPPTGGPAAPSGVVAEFLGDRFQIRWVDNSNDETGFLLSRSTDGGVTYRTLTTVGPNVTTYTDLDVTGTGTRTTFYYIVRAVNNGQASADSPAASVSFGPGAVSFATSNIGVVSPVGRTTIDAGTGIWSVSGSGADIWNSVDAFTYEAQRWTGDGEISARVVSIDFTNAWAKAGLMFRESGSADAKNAFLMVTPANGLELQARTTTGGATSFASYAALAAPVWLKLTRQGNVFRAYRSADGQNWVDAGSITIEMSAPIYVGLAVTSHAPGSLCTAKFSDVYLGAIRGAATAPPAAPSGLQATAASPTEVDLTWTDNSTDETGFHLERATAGGPFARVATPVANVRSVRDSGLTASTTYSYRISAYSTAGDSAFSTVVNVTTPAAPPPPSGAPAAPSGVVAEFSGDRFVIRWVDNSTNEAGFVISRSTDGGLTYRTLATVAANLTTHTDLDVTGTGTRTTFHYRVRAFNGSFASADSPAASVSFGPGAISYTTSNIGAVSPAGGTSVDAGTGTWSVSGSGADIWNTVDAFTYHAQRWTGDGEITARVVSIDPTNGWAKAGLMFRESTAPDARNLFLMVTPANGLELQARTTTGGATSFASYAAMAAPVWLKLTRQGNVFRAYRSTDGQIWSDAGSLTMEFAGPIYVGLAVTSHSPGALCTARFSNVYLGAIRDGSTPPAALPAAPSGLLATPMSPTEVELSWTDNSTDESGFHLERATGAGAFVRVATPAANATLIRDSGLTASTTYSYRISAYSSAGDSAFSSVATVTTPAAPPPPTGAPAAPSNVVGHSQGDRILVTWVDNSNSEEGFILERSTDASTYQSLGTVGANVTSYTDQNVPTSGPGITYYYRVRAYAGGAASAGAVGFVEFIPASSTGPLSAPGNLMATAVSGSQIDLRWIDTNSSETGHVLERSTDGVSYTVLQTLAANVTTASDLTVAASTLYSYRVRAVRGDVTSSNSNIATTTTPPSGATWFHADIGAVGIPGSREASGNTITVRGSGADIWDRADAFHFLYQVVRGDCIVEAQVTSITNTDPWAKAGVMIREDATPGARNIFVYLTPMNDTFAQVRGVPGEPTSGLGVQNGSPPPYWVRLQRTGNVITASCCADGVSWRVLGSYTLALGADALVGFAVTSHDNDVLNTATFVDPFIR